MGNEAAFRVASSHHLVRSTSARGVAAKQENDQTPSQAKSTAELKIIYSLHYERENIVEIAQPGYRFPAFSLIRVIF